MRRPALFVAAAALLAHAGGLAGGFVYDDHRFVERNERLMAAPWVDLVLDPGTHSADGDRDVYRPLRALGHRLDRLRWGRAPFGFHLHSLLVHVLCSLLAWVVLRRLLPQDSQGAAALLGATVLATHPLGVEAVGWISSRGDLYALALGLGSLWAFERIPGARRPAPWLVLAGLAALLATLGKESALALPLVAACAWRLLGRGSGAGVLALGAGVALALALRQAALGGAGPNQTSPHGGDVLTQAGWALHGMGRMLSHLLLPSGLSVDYPQARWATGSPVWIRPHTLAGGALLLAPLALRRRWPTAAFLGAWWVLAYLPSSSLLATLRSLVADRYAYPCLPAAGALAGLALRQRPRAVLPVACGLALLLGAVTATRTQAFRNDATLWRDVLGVHPASVKARLALAAEALPADASQAQAWLEDAVRVAPSHSALEGIALARLGDLLLHLRGDAAAALPALGRALHLQRALRDRDAPGPDEAVTAANLAQALSATGSHDEAEAVLASALADHPASGALRLKRALLLLSRAEQERDPDLRRRALQAWDEAARLLPDDPRLREARQRLAPAGGG